MAGGSNSKSSAAKPPSFSASSSHRKSRWEPSNPKTNNHNFKKSPADPKSTDAKPPNDPSPKPKPTPSPANAKHSNEQNPPSVSAPFPSPGGQFPFPDPASFGPPPPPAYGFHMLERRTIVLADGSVRSYFALPPDYQDFTPPHRPVDLTGRVLPIRPGLEIDGFDQRLPPSGPMSPGGLHLGNNKYGRGRPPVPGNWNALRPGSGGPSEGSIKRKYGDENEKDRLDERDEVIRQRQQLIYNSNPNGYFKGPGGDHGEYTVGMSSPFSRDAELRASKYMRVSGAYENVGFRQGGSGNVAHKHMEVDRNALKKAFLHFSKLVNENVTQKKNYFADGKQGRLQCVACGRSSKDFPDMHGLIMHTYNSDKADSLVDHLGLHKALCVLMGWNYGKAPDISKAYQFLPANDAAANQDDLIMWPPLVIIHNTITGKSKDGRMEGLGNKVMDNKIRDLGFGGGKSKSLYGRDGHLGITLVKFAGDQSGLREAIRLAKYFENDNHGRKAWSQMQPLTLGKDDDNNPGLVTVDEKKGEKKRILYGYLGTAFDLEKLDFDTRKRVTIESMREQIPS